MGGKLERCEPGGRRTVKAHDPLWDGEGLKWTCQDKKGSRVCTCACKCRRWSDPEQLMGASEPALWEEG